MKLILLYGAPGTGKYTVAKELEIVTHYKLLHNHVILNALIDVFGFNHPARKKLEKELRLKIIEEAAKANINLIATGVIMKDNELFYRQVIKLVKDAGGECILINLTADKETIRSRIENDSRKAMNKINTIERFEEWSEQYPESFEPMNTDHQLTFDTTKISAQETAKKIANIAELFRE